jgi:hypothetical protein
MAEKVTAGRVCYCYYPLFLGSFGSMNINVLLLVVAGWRTAYC